MAIHEISDQSFENEVLQSNVPVLVDFWAPWCGPCKMMEPMIDEVAQAYKGRLKVVKINTDDHQMVATNYYISGMPTLLLFKDGEVADQLAGSVPKRRIEDMVSRAVG